MNSWTGKWMHQPVRHCQNGGSYMATVKFRCGRCGHALWKAEDGTFHSRHTVNDPDTGKYVDVDKRELCEDGYPHGPVNPVDE